MEKRPYILISNDDGYQAKGFQVLIEALRPYCDILAVAPDGPRSGYSTAFTAAMPISGRLITKDAGLAVYACSGTPVDCIKLGLNRYCTRKPDLVVGGINHGDNASVNAIYSGTVGVASEGAMQGIPSLALSICDYREDADFSAVEPWLWKLVKFSIDLNMKPFTLLNVNFPKDKDIKGLRLCRKSKSRWVEEIEPCAHPYHDDKYFWLAGRCVELEPESEDTDRWALTHGYISLVPTTLDYTNYEMLEELKAGNAITTDK